MLASLVPARALVIGLAFALAGSPALAQQAPPEPEPADETEPAPEEEEREDTARAPLRADEVFPETRRPRPEPELDPELTEDFQRPVPEPEWRLRAGVGATAATSGTDVLSLRLAQEIEWMPAAVAPFLFGLTGGELVASTYQVYLAGVRIGGWARFCEDRLVVCSGAIAIRAGASFGQATGAQLDLGGDGDVRFRFDGVELAVRVGFFIASSVTFVDLLGMVGASF